VELKDGNLPQGDRVSADQFYCAVPGCRHDTFGKEQNNLKYHGGAIFVDHASGYIFLRSQTSLRTGETLTTKALFEQLAASHGVVIKAIRADNQPFGSNEFREGCDLKGQKLDFSGVGAHHQNYIAERAQRTVNSWARACLLHALIHWPDQFRMHTVRRKRFFVPVVYMY
jgi:transposase InsO family protein